MHPHIFKGSLTNKWYVSTRYRVHNAELNQFVAQNMYDVDEQMKIIIDQEVDKVLAENSDIHWHKTKDFSPSPGEVVMGLWVPVLGDNTFVSAGLCVRTNHPDPRSYQRYSPYGVQGIRQGKNYDCLIFAPDYWSHIRFLNLPEEVLNSMARETNTVKEVQEWIEAQSDQSDQSNPPGEES